MVIFFLLCVFAVSFACAGEPEILLSVTDLWNNSFNYIGRQQSFMLHVQVKNIDDSFIPPETIPGATTFLVNRTGTSRSTSIVNGVRDESFNI